jgi:hypothetical protein
MDRQWCRLPVRGARLLTGGAASAWSTVWIQPNQNLVAGHQGHRITHIKSDWNGRCIQIDSGNLRSGSALFLADCNQDLEQQMWWPHDSTPDYFPPTGP